VQSPTAHVGFSVNLPPLVPPIVLAVPIGANPYIAGLGFGGHVGEIRDLLSGPFDIALAPAENLDPVLTTLIERELTLRGAA
jgi:hypothetical protein